MKVSILSVAEAEFDDAIQYYENELAGLGLQFHEAVSSAIGRIMDFPKPILRSAPGHDAAWSQHFHTAFFTGTGKSLGKS